jgi:hypothetical protein
MGKSKEFLLLTYFEDLAGHESFVSKRMFGGMAVYYKGLNVAVLKEDPGDKTYRGKKFSFDIWDGVMIPTSREFHSLLQKDLPDLVPHPVLGKWLYLPQQTEHFEEIFAALIILIRRGDYRIGIIPAQKKTKKISIARKKKAKKRKKSALTKDE